MKPRRADTLGLAGPFKRSVEDRSQEERGAEICEVVEGSIWVRSICNDLQASMTTLEDAIAMAEVARQRVLMVDAA